MCTKGGAPFPGLLSSIATSPQGYSEPPPSPDGTRSCHPASIGDEDHRDATVLLTAAIRVVAGHAAPDDRTGAQARSKPIDFVENDIDRSPRAIATSCKSSTGLDHDAIRLDGLHDNPGR